MARDMQEICKRYQEICKRYSRDMQKICKSGRSVSLQYTTWSREPKCPTNLNLCSSIFIFRLFKLKQWLKSCTFLAFFFPIFSLLWSSARSKGQARADKHKDATWVRRGATWCDVVRRGAFLVATNVARLPLWYRSDAIVIRFFDVFSLGSKSFKIYRVYRLVIEWKFQYALEIITLTSTASIFDKHVGSDVAVLWNQGLMS